MASRTVALPAHRSGVATVFAYVTYNGTTVSDSFPIKVIPDLTPASISVNGTLLHEFDPELKAYSFLINEETRMPVVSAEAINKATGVEIEQVTSIPGTAIIRFIDYNTMEENSYYLNFDRNSVSDDFNDDGPGKQWRWIIENSENYWFASNAG